MPKIKPQPWSVTERELILIIKEIEGKVIFNIKEDLININMNPIFHINNILWRKLKSALQTSQ
jgi:hypothetical protein